MEILLLEIAEVLSKLVNVIVIRAENALVQLILLHVVFHDLLDVVLHRVYFQIESLDLCFKLSVLGLLGLIGLLELSDLVLELGFLIKQ